MKIWGYIKSIAYLQAYEGYTDDYVAIKMGAVKKRVKIEVDVKKKQDQAAAKYADMKDKAKDAKDKIAEQGKITLKAFNDNMTEEIKLLDSTYQQKYGDKLIDAHVASASYLKANGKIIGDYKYDMAVIAEKMKNAKILGLDEEWQKEQVNELKEKNAEKVAEMQDKKVKAEKKAAEAEEQKEVVDAMESKVPALKELPNQIIKVNELGKKVFFTSDEKAKAKKAQQKAATALASKYGVKGESYKIDEKEEDSIKEQSYVKDLSKLIYDPEFNEKIAQAADDDEKKSIIKDGLETFKEGYEEYMNAKMGTDKIKADVVKAVEGMAEGERPRGASSLANQWKNIDPDKSDINKNPTSLYKEIEEKIKLAGDPKVKPNEVLKMASGSGSSQKIEDLKQEIESLKKQKEEKEEEIQKWFDEKGEAGEEDVKLRKLRDTYQDAQKALAEYEKKNNTKVSIDALGLKIEMLKAQRDMVKEDPREDQEAVIDVELKIKDAQDDLKAAIKKEKEVKKELDELFTLKTKKEAEIKKLQNA